MFEFQTQSVDFRSLDLRHFFPVLLSSHHYPSGGPCCITVPCRFGLYTIIACYLYSRLYDVLHASITAKRMCIKGPIYSAYMSLLRNRVECKIHFLSNRCCSNHQRVIRINQSCIFCHDAKEVFICWLSRSRIAGLVSERSPDCASRPRRFQTFIVVTLFLVADYTHLDAFC